jgi:PIN domain nuclease of toxin-antitoxin system
MKALLDTHVFLWWIDDDSRLSASAKTIIENSENQLFFSAASAWEIAIKTQLGKMRLPSNSNLDKFIATHLSLNGFEPLPISLSHALHTASFPSLHKDPFDRILIAQSRLEGLPLLTGDALITQYSVETIW